MGSQYVAQTVVESTILLPQPHKDYLCPWPILDFFACTPGVLGTLHDWLFSISLALLWSFSTFESLRLFVIQGLKYPHSFINTKHIISFSYHLQKRFVFQPKRNTFRNAASLLHSDLWRTQLSQTLLPWGSQPYPGSGTKWVGYKLQWPFKIPQGQALGHLTVIDYGFCSQLRIF